MLTKAVITASLGAILATGLGIATSANAGNIGVNIHMGAGPVPFSMGVPAGYRQPHNRGYFNPGYKQPKHYGRKKHRRNYYRSAPRRAICNPRKAVNKAYRLGLDGPQVERVRERRIIVSGYQYGYRTKMVFKRYSNCKLIKTVRFNR